MPTTFILPAVPVLRDRPPKGPEWLHEVKFDGYRVRVCKDRRDVIIYSKGGADFTARYAAVAQAAATLMARSVAIDAEVTVLDEQGRPDFGALHSRKFPQERLCLWAFDLLECDGKDLRELPLIARRVKLGRLLQRCGNPFLRYSEAFTDAEKLLAQCARHGLEGIVSKRKDGPYRSGPRADGSR